MKEKRNREVIEMHRRKLRKYRILKDICAVVGGVAVLVMAGSADSYSQNIISTAEAGIECVGFEKSEKIYEKAKRRLEEEMAQMSIFDLGVERI